MPATPDIRAARINAAIIRGTKLQQLIDVLEQARRYDMAHARTNRSSDYLDLILARHEASKLLDEVLEADLSDYREMLADEAHSECAYDIAECNYVDDNGDAILHGQPHTPRGYNDWRYDQMRDAELGL